MEIEKNHSPANFVSRVKKFIFGLISITFAKDQLYLRRKLPEKIYKNT